MMRPPARVPPRPAGKREPALTRHSAIVIAIVIVAWLWLMLIVIGVANGNSGPLDCFGLVASIVFLIGVPIVIVRFLARRGTRIVQDGVAAGIRAVGNTPPPLPQPAIPDGAGWYRVDGVDRETRMDTTWYTHAESSANAKIKAELNGIIPTLVERQPDSK